MFQGGGKGLGDPATKVPPTLVEKTEPNQKEKPWFLGVSRRAREAGGPGWDPLNQGFLWKSTKAKTVNGKR